MRFKCQEPERAGLSEDVESWKVAWVSFLVGLGLYMGWTLAREVQGCIGRQLFPPRVHELGPRQAVEHRSPGAVHRSPGADAAKHRSQVPAEHSTGLQVHRLPSTRCRRN